MSTCCARLSKVYMVFTNLLFAFVGIAFIAFGLIGIKNGFNGATLFPENIFKYFAILGAIICIASLFGIIGAYVRKNFITIIYLIVIVAALILQVLIGIRIYQKAANTLQYLSDLWPSSSFMYRLELQNEFNCCGYQTTTDNVALSDTCQATVTTLNALPPCATILATFIKTTFNKVYLAVFVGLALELLAICNAITLLCSNGSSFDDEEERRKRRKSGIRLDDMTADSPTTLVGYQADEQKQYYAGGNTNTYSQEPVRDNRYDSYDIYRQNQQANHYNEGYNNRPYGNGAYY
ncbi:Tetraspanin family-domain-containing protein [Gilbertella persicaria]|uniref:Tetraspanin family-domain-containing protein n=1 Tax=Gilbertella persicaria TaxID=101096 RepID=UPI00221EBA77|nr:Tetraspanin family-domain-containing protein [Gilbertella persicaria]KAI8059423.1 Tetraspanin family-domain-containing protein [Gilbertella persicaria]